MTKKRKRVPGEGRSPALAAALSCVMPGAGHIYAGKRVKGLLFAVIVLGMFVCGITVFSGGMKFGTASPMPMPKFTQSPSSSSLAILIAMASLVRRSFT